MADETPDNPNPVPPSGDGSAHAGGGAIPPSGTPSGAPGSGLGSGAKPPSRERGLIEGALKQMGGAKFSFTPKPPSLAKDAILGYEITREIHRGGQGVVYQALQRSTQKKVAIKVMHGGVFASATDRARIEREVRILANLNHPNIVKVHDSGEVQGAYYFVMDYISGHSLDSYIRSGPHAIEQTLKLFTTICEAVNAAHLKGVIHRDLKPGNIRIDAEGTPHILDFGLAKLALDEHSGGQQMTATGQFVGSLYWASPEQALGNPSTIDIRTDVYSLGVILYQMLTVGKFPYEVLGNMRDVLDNIMRAEPAKPSTVRRQINDEVETIVLKCLQKERDRRYQSAGDVGRDIVRYLTGEPIEAKRESGLYVIGKNLRKHKGAVFSIGTIVAILAASGVVFSVLYAKEKTANKATVAAKAVADIERDRAERNAKEVRTLALSFMLDVADKLENLRGATKTREGVLRTAKDSLTRLAAEPGASEDAQLQKELADAWARVGAIEGGLYLPRVGTVAASVTSYAHARTIRETLLAQSPNDPQLLAAMAESRKHTGQGLQRHRKFDEAKTEFDNAIADLNKAITAAGTSTFSLELAEKKLAARMDLADLAKVRAAELRDAEKSPAMTAEAMGVYSEVESYWSERLKLNPADEKAARMLGVVRDKKAQTQVAFGRSLMAGMTAAIKVDKVEEAKVFAQRAKAAFESARDLSQAASDDFARLTVEQPANRQIKRDQYIAVYNIGDANMRLAELVSSAAERKLLPVEAKDADTVNEVALAKFREALEIADRLASADDSNLEALHDVGLALNKVGNPLRSLNRVDDAAMVFERSLALREDLNKSDPTDQHLKDLAVGQYKRGEILELSSDRTSRSQLQRIADLSKSVLMYEKALETYSKQSEAKLEVRADDVKLVKESLDRAREKLGKLQVGG